MRAHQTGINDVCVVNGLHNSIAQTKKKKKKKKKREEENRRKEERKELQ